MLRRQAATPRIRGGTAAAIAAPFGDGSTRGAVKGRRADGWATATRAFPAWGCAGGRPAGPPPGPYAAAARVRLRSASDAGPPGPQDGRTRMPLSTATLSAVVNDSTSTVTRQAASLSGLRAVSRGKSLTPQ